MVAESKPQPNLNLTNQPRSFFSIIEFDFTEPFSTEQGPPEAFKETFTKCVVQLDVEEKPEWIVWGNDSTDPVRVCIMIGQC